MRYRKFSSNNSIFRLAAILCLAMLGLPALMASSQRLKNHIFKPLIVLNDANNPSISLNGDRISVSSQVGVCDVYDIATGRILRSYRQENSDVCILSADGKKVSVSGAGVRRVFHVDTGDKLFESLQDINSSRRGLGQVFLGSGGGLPNPNYSSDLTHGADVVRDERSSRTEMDGRRPVLFIGRLDDISVKRELFSADGIVKADSWREVSMTPDGKLVGAIRVNSADSSRDRTVIWDVASGEITFELPFRCYSFSLSHNGERVVTRRADGDMRIEVWNIKSGKRVSTLTQKADGKSIKVGQTAISPNGRLIVTTRDAHFYFWNAETGEFLASQKQISDEDSHAAVFSGDGRRIVVTGYDELVTVWSVDEILYRRNK